MPGLLSGKALRSGGSNTYIQLSGAQPQLPQSATTTTGYTINTDSKLVTTYRSSLGNLQMDKGSVWNNLGGNITLIGTGTSTVIVLGGTLSTSTNTGALVVHGGVGISNDINVNNLTIGQGYQSQAGGVNNIVISGQAVPTINNFNNGQENVNIGYSSLQGISTAYKDIAIGRYALSSGTNLSFSIAIGDSSLKQIGVVNNQPVGPIIAIQKGVATILTVNNHGLSTGTQVYIDGVTGMTQLNSNYYWISVVDISNVELYTDNILGNALDSTGFPSWSGGGELYRKLAYDGNIGIGVNTGIKLIDGEQNILIGHNCGTNLTTGSYNFFFGHEIGNNITTGTNNVALGGDNLVDGLDHQVSIGSVFYFDGKGLLHLYADTTTGLGTNSTGTSSGALVVVGGVGISGNMFVGSDTHILSTLDSTLTSNGALVVDGGVGIGLNLNVGHDAHVFRAFTVDGTGDVNLNPQSASVIIEPALGGTVIIRPSATGNIDNMVIGQNNAQQSFFTDAHATHFIGFASTATSLEGGALGSLPYQIGYGETGFINIGPANSILTSNGTTATWSVGGSLTAGTASNANNIFVHPINSKATYYLDLSTEIGDYGAVDADANLTYVTTTATTSSYFITGTSVLNVPGSIYSMEGSADENNLLYTPRVVVGPTPPPAPRVGDFWIDLTTLAQYQWINDNGSRFWIQIAQL